MPKFKEGDRVRVKARQASDKEALEGHYAPFLAGTTGTILKIYDPKQIAVKLDIDSLPEEVRQRHAEQQEAMYRRWFDSLSEEARNRLTDEEKAFRLNYVVLLTESDLESPSPAGSPRPRPVKPSGGRASQRAEKSQWEGKPPDEPKKAATGGQAARRAKTSGQATQATTGQPKAETKPTAARKPRKQAEAAPEPPMPTRPTPEQLDLLEAAYLKARQRKSRP
ncbi:hypothetical protein HRbin15_00548 [bacterium HR15]|nr:hypothetical protein HRbin15_00548 [bacterium HR15]